VPAPVGGTTGDGNGDGIADREQQDVASVPFRNTPQPTQEPDAPPVFVSLTGGSEEGKSTGSGVKLTNVRQIDRPDDAPDSLEMPLGMIAFDAEIADVGGTEQFSLYVEGSVAVNGYWKQSNDGTWVNLASPEYGGRIVLEGDKLRLDFEITDGGQFDADGVANGVISDPGTLSFERNVLEEQVQSLYLAYYQRPADSAGLIYWRDQLAEREGDLTQIAEAFANSNESQALYGTIDSGNVEGFIHTLYEGLFDRQADNEGLTFYKEAFVNGAYPDGRGATAASMMLDILYGAKASDEDMIVNKLDVARTFTWMLDPDRDGDVLATFDQSDLNAIRSWLNSFDEQASPTVGEIRDIILEYVADQNDPIVLAGGGNVTDLLY